MSEVTLPFMFGLSHSDVTAPYGGAPRAAPDSLGGATSAGAGRGEGGSAGPGTVRPGRGSTSTSGSTGDSLPLQWADHPSDWRQA